MLPPYLSAATCVRNVRACSADHACPAFSASSAVGISTSAATFRLISPSASAAFNAAPRTVNVNANADLNG